ncbi:hypothetical protein JKP88DRAFT_331987, partial [Tribonema minus]
RRRAARPVLQTRALAYAAAATVPAAEHAAPLPKICSTVEEFREARRALAGKRVGFVPTMGALHAGHLSLFRAARAENEAVVASIFVNPAQFAPHEDFDKYPRQLEKDVALLHKEGLADLVFAPTSAVMYGPHHCVYVDPHGVEALSEGAARPGFFRGVATVVAKLFNVVQPDAAYFGQKDALQCVVIRRMVADLNFPLKVRVLPTARDADGLALSSRNAYLTPDERAAAPVVHRALLAARAAWQRGVAAAAAAGSAAAAARADLEAVARAELAAEPLVAAVEYVSVGCRETMAELESVTAAGAVVSVAVKVGGVRLIDNMVLGPPDE